MIDLERPGKQPPYFASGEIVRFRKAVQGFFYRAEKQRRQERPDFPLFPRTIYHRLLEDLAGLSHGKCAYCESPLESGSAGLDRFRPKAGAVGLSGEFSTEHYWWLAYEWKNIYPCCIKCNKFKAGKFPVEGSRCPPGADWPVVGAEHRLLVDPFQDRPDEHLDFQPDGTVVPRSSMGDVTIHTLELNRSDLVAARARIAKDVHAFLDRRWAAPLNDKSAAWLQEALSHSTPPSRVPPVLREVPALIAARRPYSAVARAELRRWLDKGTGAGKASAPKPASRRAAGSRRSAPQPTSAVFGKTVKERQVSRKVQALRSRIVTRVAIRNFRGVRDLDLEIDVQKGEGAPWTVLLGENATGKSSILQAIALTLLAGDGTGAAATTPVEVIKKGTTRGSVQVWLDESTEPRVLTFARSRRRFERSGPEYPGVLLGYGATRLLPRTLSRASAGRVRLDNMFDPFSPLLDADRWLGELDPTSFDFVARALKDVLALPRSATLRRKRRRGAPGVELRLFGTDLSLRDLSDGYQSVLGLTCDIIAGLHASSKGALEAAEGLVAIDELGAHLHPRWRMRIVESLRRAFRRVQFFVSTHDPLCLRGLENGEAVVLRRTSRGRVFSVPDLPPIKGLRVDQLLTSEYFGLNSTMDPVIELKYREMYRLLALREPSAKQTERIAQLRVELAPFEIPGATRRERRLLEIIDKELAQTDEEADPQKRQAIKVQSDELVADLNRLIASGEAAV
jgi:uncharacterized protein (TIGR02646 family)